MTRTLCLTSALLLAAVPAMAQRGGGAPAAPVSLAAGLQRSYATVKQNLTEMAAAMPEADYGFKATPEVRSFGQLFGHVADSAYRRCSAARGLPNPNEGTSNEEKTTKADVQKVLADSFAFCDEAYKALTDASAGELVAMGRNKQARGSILADNIAHDNEMYGTGVVYMRLKGLVPPSTARRVRKP